MRLRRAEEELPVRSQLTRKVIGGAANGNASRHVAMAADQSHWSGSFSRYANESFAGKHQGILV
jgi:hypothetical protein